MTSSERIRALVADAIRRIHEESGRSAPEISGELRPFDEAEGLDSLNCLELEVLLSKELGISGEGLIFEEDKEWEKLSVEELVQRVSARLPKQDG